MALLAAFDNADPFDTIGVGSSRKAVAMFLLPSILVTLNATGGFGLRRPPASNYRVVAQIGPAESGGHGLPAFDNAVSQTVDAGWDDVFADAAAVFIL